MSEHLTSSKLESYRSRALSPGDLLLAVAHLAECPECRAGLNPSISANLATATNLAAIRGSFSDAAHLQFEEMESYLAGEAPPETRAMVEAHLGNCDRCAHEVSDLRGFMTLPAPGSLFEMLAVQQEMEEEKSRSSWFSRAVRSRAYQLGVAAVVLLIAFGAYRYSPIFKGNASGDRLNTVQAPAPASVKLPPAELSDGSRKITITSDGVISGLQTFPPPYRDRVSAVLSFAHFDRPSYTESTWAQHELLTARTAFADSHLLLGTLELHAGHYAEARQEFTALAAENPGSDLAASLLHKLDELSK